MRQLAQLQADFQSYIYDAEQGAHFKNSIIDDAKVGAQTRLGIYHDAYRLRIIEVLASVYPNLLLLLGDDLFEDITRSYIDAYPSTYRNMRWVGDQLHTHLTQHLPQHPIAAQMAMFEWALGLAFDAKDVPTLTLADVSQIPPEDWANITLTFHPSFQLLPILWNVIATWQALDQSETPPAPTQNNEACIVWRQDMNSFYRSINSEEQAAMSFVAHGETFGALCTFLMQDGKVGEDDATQQAARYLANWLNETLLLNTLN